MGRMIADAEDSLDHLGDPLGGPDLPAIAKGLRSSCQYLWQLGQLLSTQLALGARCRVTTQRLHSLGPASFEPLADRSFAHSQRHSNVFLLPALLRQFPGSSTTPFFPIFSVLVFLHASILSCLASYAAVNKVILLLYISSVIAYPNKAYVTTFTLMHTVPCPPWGTVGARACRHPRGSPLQVQHTAWPYMVGVALV